MISVSKRISENCRFFCRESAMEMTTIRMLIDHLSSYNSSIVFGRSPKCLHTLSSSTNYSWLPYSTIYTRVDLGRSYSTGKNEYLSFSCVFVIFKKSFQFVLDSTFQRTWSNSGGRCETAYHIAVVDDQQSFGVLQEPVLSSCTSQFGSSADDALHEIVEKPVLSVESKYETSGKVVFILHAAKFCKRWISGLRSTWQAIWTNNGVILQ